MSSVTLGAMTDMLESIDPLREYLNGCEQRSSARQAIAHAAANQGAETLQGHSIHYVPAQPFNPPR